MRIVFSSSRVEEVRTDLRKAEKHFGGDKALARSLFSRINAFRCAVTIKDIINQPSFRSHKLNRKRGKDLEGFFAIDVKTVRQQWRMLVRPLDSNLKPFDGRSIDVIAMDAKIIEVKEISKHYE